MNDATDPTSRRDYVELKGMLRALGDVARLHMVEILASANEISVTELAQRLVTTGRPITQPLVSWHLAILRRHGLVRTRRHGRLVYCSLDTARYQHCLRKLAEVVAQPAATTAATPVAPRAEPSETPPDALGVHRRG
jgi:ArsR family transcriptional regulator